MTNFEFYKKYFSDDITIGEMTRNIALVIDRETDEVTLIPCAVTNCRECLFHFPKWNCNEMVRDWLKASHCVNETEIIVDETLL